MNRQSWKDCHTYTPPDGGGLRWSEERFSNPEGSSYRGGCGRTDLGGNCGCDPSGSLEYGEGDARCPLAGEPDPRLKKLITLGFKAKSRPQNQLMESERNVESCAVAASSRAPPLSGSWTEADRGID